MIARRILLGVGLIICTVAVLLAWIAYTPSGTRQLVRLASRALGDKLVLEQVDGALAHRVTVATLRYHDPASGVDLRIGNASFEVTLRALFQRRLRLPHLTLSELVLDLLPVPASTASGGPIRLPVAIELDDVTLASGEVRRAGVTLFTLEHAALAGSWTNAGVVVQRLDVSAAQGEAHLSGRLASAAPYTGNAEGRFQWRAGERTYAGTVTVEGDGGRAILRAELSAPLAANVGAEIEPRAPFAWRLTMNVPTFDPGQSLAPASPVGSVAASLEGHGDLSTAAVRGTLVVGGERIHVEDARLRLDADTLHVDALTLQLAEAPGRLEMTGTLALQERPLRGRVELEWNEIQLPAQWVGQALETRGRLTFAGSEASFDSSGEMAIGPPGRLADVTWQVAGSLDALVVERFTVAQAPGRLTATGRVSVLPHASWQLTAQGESFDPGTFVAGWPGSLGFELLTEGELVPDAQRASFELRRLSGTLRRRPISGEGELTLSSGMRVVGALQVRSGESLLRVTGKRDEAMDVAAELSVASLAAWHSSLSGSLNARARSVGRWPDVRIEAAASGEGLAFEDARVGTATLNVNVRNPQHPQGEMSLDAQAIAFDGFRFDSVEARLSGSEKKHSAALRAQGEPLATELTLDGGYAGGTWSGTLSEWRLDVAEVPSLRLESPVRATVARTGAFDLSESCLTGEDIKLCLSAGRSRDGEMLARYVIEHLPLDLVARLALPEQPIAVAGTIEGHGDLRRREDGAVFGTAQISSASGHAASSADASAPRLEYEDLVLDADLQGDAARLRLRASLLQQGELAGDVEVTNLRSPDPVLSGTAGVALRDLSPLAVFVPQFANVTGAGEVTASAEGTLGAPRVTASLRISDFNGELPQLGLALKQGHVTADLRPGAGVEVSGGITSGEGTVDVSGNGAAGGPIELKVEGREFLAANIPGAHIVATPQLELTGTLQDLVLTGRLEIPSADIDLDELTEGRGERVSPDVVVVDREETAEERVTRLHTDVTIVLGENVKLVGFGLDAEAEGELRVREGPGTSSVGSGEIRLEGTYEAYGRELEIERGRLMFAGTPLDDPQLDVLAVRKLRDVTAKLRVTGTAQRPQPTVFAEPAMSPTEALSYLISGKPVDELHGDEGARMQSAAQSLGSIVVGNKLTKNLGARLGIDDVGIQQSAELGSSAFTVGKYLSPRFYVSYGVGLFEPGQVVTMRYELSDRFSVEVKEAPEDHHAGVYYRIER